MLMLFPRKTEFVLDHLLESEKYRSDYSKKESNAFVLFYYQN